MTNKLEAIQQLKSEINLNSVNNLLVSPIERNFQKVNYDLHHIVTDTVNELTLDAGISIESQTVKTTDNQLYNHVGTDIFPDTLNLFIWSMDSATIDAVAASYAGHKYGGKDLTVRGSAMTNGADVLGDNVFCQATGTSYLESADTVFINHAYTTFSLGVWIYRADWSAAVGGTAINFVGCGVAATGGFRLQLITTEALQIVEINGGTTVQTPILPSLKHLSPGWHHFMWRRDNVTNYIHIDGLVVAKKAVNTIASGGAGQLLQFGANGAGAGPLLSGMRIDEIAFDTDTFWTAEYAKRIYGASSKKTLIVDNNSVGTINGDLPIVHEDTLGVTSIPGQSACLVTTATALTMTNAANTTILFDTIVRDQQNEYVAATGLFTAKEAGWYQVNAAAMLEATTNFVWGEIWQVVIAINGTATYVGQADNTNSTVVAINKNSQVSNACYLSAGDTVSILGFQNSGGNLNLINGATYNYFSVVKIA